MTQKEVTEDLELIMEKDPKEMTNEQIDYALMEIEEWSCFDRSFGLSPAREWTTRKRKLLKELRNR